MLTRKQHELPDVHPRAHQGDSVSPSFDEMKEALDLASKSGIHRLISSRRWRSARFLGACRTALRALEVIKLPEQATASAAAEGSRALPPRRWSKRAPAAAMEAGAANDTREVPILGKIAAGSPDRGHPAGARPYGRAREPAVAPASTSS